MHGVCYQSCMRVPQNGDWEEYSVVQSPDWYIAEVGLSWYRVEVC